MSYSDLESNDQSGRGKSAGSRRTHFSSDKQPSKRRRRKPRSDLASGMFEALMRPTTVTIGGVQKTMPAHEVLTTSIVHDLLKAPVRTRLNSLAQIQKIGCAKMLSAMAKLDADRAEFEAERREFAKQQQFARQVAALSRDRHARLKADWYAAAAVICEIREHIEWGDGTERLADRVEIICRAFEVDRQLDAQMDDIFKELRARGEPDEREDEEWEGDDDRDDDDRDDDDPNHDERADIERHDPSTDGAVEYDPAEFDESSIPDARDPNDPALDLANGQLGAEGFNPPVDDDQGEVGS